MKYLLPIGLCLVMIVSACQSASDQQISVADAVSTAVAATQAFNDAASTLAAQIVATNQPTSTQTATSTATELPAAATVSINANCRSGPASNFDRIAVLEKGMGGRVLGKNTTGSSPWYELELSDGKQCWVIADELTLTGRVAEVPEIASPPTPTPVPPASLWAGKWTIWQSGCPSGNPECESVKTSTWTMTGPNTIVFSNHVVGGICTFSSVLTISADGTLANGALTSTAPECGIWDIHITLDPNHYQFRGWWKQREKAWDSYFCGALHGYGKPSPCR